MKTPKFEIIAGTYEEFLLGFHFISKQAELFQSFAIHEHSSSIRCVATSGNYFASGAADDRIIVYDLNLRKEHCMLNHHNSTVNCLQFTNNHSHLISGSSDGELAIVRVGNWQLEKMWENAHKGSAILDIAVHPSGKLALTIGSDCSLRTWNLVKGRQAYIINLNSKSKDARSLEKIIWAEDAVRFILWGGKYTEIWSIESGGILKVIEHDEKISSCIWMSTDEILVGYENGQIALIEINECSKNEQEAHNGRVKALAKYEKWVVSASSTGEIKVWNKKLKELSKYDTGCRITCLAIVLPTVKIKAEDVKEPIEVVEESKENPVKKGSVVVQVEDSDNDEDNFRIQAKQSSKKADSERISNTDNSAKQKKKKKRKIEHKQDDEKELLEAGNVKHKKIKEVVEHDIAISQKCTEVLNNNGKKLKKVKKQKNDEIKGKDNRTFKKKNKIKT